MTIAYGLGFDFVRPRSRRARIARIDALATLLDSALVIPGTGVRFGLDALIGLVPAVGDIVTTALSLFTVHEAYQLGAPGHILLRMLSNVVVDGALGAVPVVGDAFDVVRRNVRLLREWLERGGLAILGGARSFKFLVASQPSLLANRSVRRLLSGPSKK
jgi:hypothetical protein